MSDERDVCFPVALYWRPRVECDAGSSRLIAVDSHFSVECDALASHVVSALRYTVACCAIRPLVWCSPRYVDVGFTVATIMCDVDYVTLLQR